MITYEATGKVDAIGQVKETASGFRSRDFVVDTLPAGQYRNPLKFTLKKDRVDKADAFAVGDTVTVKFSTDGRRWTSPDGTVKFFVDLSAWEITKVAASGGGAAPTGNGPATWQTVMDAWQTKHPGSTGAEFKAWCEATFPEMWGAAAAAGKKFAALAAETPGAMDRIVAAINGDAAPAAEEAPDDSLLPF